LAGYSKAVFIYPCLDRRISCGGFLHKLGLYEDVPVEKTKTQQIKAAIIWRLLYGHENPFSQKKETTFFTLSSVYGQSVLC
jgi:hypothetical protein